MQAESLDRLFPWKRHFAQVNRRRMAYIDEGDRSGRPVLLLSGNPTWGFLYRDFVAPLGTRAIVPSHRIGLAPAIPTIRAWTRR